jgi:hypothetical protein
MQRIPPQYQPAAKVGEALGISARVLLALARRRAIPSLRIGHRTVLMDLEKVRAALARFEVREIGRSPATSAAGSKQEAAK